MEYVIIGVVLVAALACPVLMWGPMLLRRFGILKGGSAGMSCMGMMSTGTPSRRQQLRDLTAKRRAIDDEIARIKSAVPGPDAQQPAAAPAVPPRPTSSPT